MLETETESVFMPMNALYWTSVLCSARGPKKHGCPLQQTTANDTHKMTLREAQLPYFAVLSEEKTTTYPEVRYLFKDDPLYDSVEEEAIIIELDEKGEQISSCKSLCDDLGILGVEMRDKDSTKTIMIHATRSIVEDMAPTDDLQQLRRMVREYELRNRQLQQVISND